MEEGMPFYEYRQEISEFSEVYQFCKEFNTTPDKIKSWKQEDPYEFNCFKSFFQGMAGAEKEVGDIKTNGTSNN